MSNRELTRRAFLVLKTMEITGCEMPLAIRAVEEVSEENPEIDMKEYKRWLEFEQEYKHDSLYLRRRDGLES